LNCEKCGKKILDENSSFCAYCGVPFNSGSNNSDFLANAGILAVIAAAFSVAAGFVGITSYQSYVAYYSAYGMDASGAIGFLPFAVLAFVASIFGFAAAVFSFKGKRFKLTILGTTLMCASAIFTFITIWYYELGYTDGILVSGLPTLALALTSTILLVKSKKSFSDYIAEIETPEAPQTDANIDESIFKD
jgi:hypothetical protein